MKKTLLTLLLSMYNIYFLSAQLNIKNISSSTHEKITFPNEFVEYNNLLFFISSSTSYGNEILVSDGNSNNTKLLKDINPGTGSGINTLFSKSSVQFKNSLYFVANDGQTGNEIWKTDGTTEGTIRITDTLNATIPQLTVIGDSIFFLAIKNNSNTLQVWKSDGTKSGTSLVKKDIELSNTPSFQGKCNNKFIFTFRPNGSNNSRVWRSDGTEAGTYPITDELNGNGAAPVGTSSLTQYIELNNYLYFVTIDGIMKTDGTLTNTVLVKNLHNEYNYLIKSADVIELNNKLYFSFYQSDVNRIFIYESDGSGSGTKKIYDKFGYKYFIPSILSKNNNFLLFTGNNSNGETSLLSLNTINYNVNEISVLSNNPTKPFIFYYYDNCFLNPFGNNIFISVRDNNYSWDGWIYNLTQNTIQKYDTLKGVTLGFAYDNKLAFSRSVSGMSDFWLLSTELPNTINKISNSNVMNIYPNPAHDFISVSMVRDEEPIDLTIYNMQGQKVKVLKLNNNKICISDLPIGCYYLSINKGEKHFSFKFIKD